MTQSTHCPYCGTGRRVSSNGLYKCRKCGDAVWLPEPDITSDGIDAAQSGVATDKDACWVETTVTGPGTLAFQWKLATGGTRSGIDLLINGDYEDGLESDADWTAYSLPIDAWFHVIRWEYWNQDAESSGTAWLDQVAWDGAYPTATSTTPDPVPYVWLDAEAKPFVTHFFGDYEAAGNADAANGENKIWECYVAGISPTNATQVFRAVVLWISAHGFRLVPRRNLVGEWRAYNFMGTETCG